MRIAGYTLIEVLITLALGTVLIAGATQLYNRSSHAYRVNEQLALLDERAAFALRALTTDIAQAGFWGLHNDATRITVPAGLNVRCSGNDVTGWALQLTVGLAVEPVAALPCPAFASFAPGSPIVIVRHASGAARAPEPNRLQVHTDTEAGYVTTTGAPTAGLAMHAQVHDVEVHAWYIDRRSSEPGLPALRRYTLARNQLLRNEEIMPGVSDLRVTLGIDMDADQRVDSFVAPAAVAGRPVVAINLELDLIAPNAWGFGQAHTQRVSRTVYLRNSS